ncbi:ABC-type transport auxiliary lipoprotein family protein [Legionella yabuuchiae]|uniref:ABC-type transport auxiliary lipoprotein family protein n=1 Tax=Legionella yabuuchiae TaxID=376727 RepID=UPI001F5F441C|nr:ABC-type transport auxiliary lipoprotein family protein [Legionella yabuuchiae]
MRLFGITILVCLLSACAVKTSVQNKYKLAEFSSKPSQVKHRPSSILVSSPIAASGYDTAQMLYMIKPYELSPFSKNAWIDAPSGMLFPLIVQSLQASHYFYAVTSIPYSDRSDYRLDTQLISLQQNFLCKPSVLDLVVKNVITNTQENQVIASRIFTHHIPCPMESPYGGVLAANQATKLYTAELTDFVIKTINRDRGLGKVP